MRGPIRPLVPCLLLACPRAAAAPGLRERRRQSDGGDPGRPLGGRRSRRRAGYADPVAAKLVTVFPAARARRRHRGRDRRLHGAAARTGRTRRCWSAGGRRRSRADPDQAAALAQCAAGRLPWPRPLLRCAEAIPPTPAAPPSARHLPAARLDRCGIPIPASEAAFLRAGPAWSDAGGPVGALPAVLPGANPAAAARQVARLDASRPAQPPRPGWRSRRDDPQRRADWPPGSPAGAGRSRDWCWTTPRWLRRDRPRTRRVALWRAAAATRQRARRRSIAARSGPSATCWPARCCTPDDAAGAYALAAAHGQIADEQRLDAEFLAGFIALRRLNDPPARDPGISRRSPSLSGPAITQGRAHYWLGRAAAAAGQDPHAEYRQAPPPGRPPSMASLPPLALGEDPAALAEPHRARCATRLRLATGPRISPGTRWCAPPLCWSPGASRGARTRFLLRMDELAPTRPNAASTAPLAPAARAARHGGVRSPAAWGATGWCCRRPAGRSPCDPGAAPLDPAIALGAHPPGEQLRHPAR